MRISDWSSDVCSSDLQPSAFIRTLHDCGALAAVLPEVEALYGVPQRPEYHPEVDTGGHVELVCDMAARLAPGDTVIGFAALTHDLGKALTPADELQRHVKHEQRGHAPQRENGREKGGTPVPKANLGRTQ